MTKMTTTSVRVSMEHSQSIASKAAVCSVTDRFATALFRQVDGASLAWFRMAFGAIMFIYALKTLVTGAVTQMYVLPRFHFQYFGFGWVHPLPGIGMYVVFVALGLLALLIMLGLMYRFATIAFAITFTYIFLIDRTFYQNHYYLVCLLSWMLVLIPAARTFSFDSLNSKSGASTVPGWALWLVRFHIGLPYFMGGIAKIDGDWLYGQPMRMMLSGKTWMPVIGPYVAEDWMVSLFVWGGLLFDLLVVPGLLWRRTRPLAFLVSVGFHLTNATMFTIGIFPWLMIAATLVFFAPRWPRQVFPGRKVLTAEKTRVHWANLGNAKRTFALGFVVYICFHAIWPMRYLVMPGNPSWTERGHFFAWHMLLRGKKTGLRMFEVDQSGEPRIIDLRKHVAMIQMPKLGRDPENIRQMASHLAAERERELGHPVQVRAFALVSMNGRKPELMIDPKVDLGAQPATLSMPGWIMPVTEPLRRDHWDVPLLAWERVLGIDSSEVMGFDSSTKANAVKKNL